MQAILISPSKLKKVTNPESSETVTIISTNPDETFLANSDGITDHDCYTEDITITIQQSDVVAQVDEAPLRPPPPPQEEDPNSHPNCIEYMNRIEEMQINEIAEILKNPDLNKLSTMPPVRPKGGSVYVYKLENTTHKRNIRCDQYIWHEQGSTPIPRKSKIVKRYYFTIRGTDGPNHSFKKYEHIMYTSFGRMVKGRAQELHYPCFCLVQYIGDETVFTNWVHRNSKKTAKPYVRLLASVRDSIEKDYKDTPPQQVYNIMNKYGMGNSKLGATYSPKSVGQIHDIQKHIRRKRVKEERQVKELRAQEDDMTLAKETAQQLPGFFLSAVINKQKNYSSIHLGLVQMLNEFNRILQLEKTIDKSPPCMYFHRHYRFGASYLTVVSFRHPLFEDEPLMPLAFLISQGDYSQGFVDFFRTIASNCDETNTAPFAFITDIKVDSTVDDEIFTGSTRFAPWNFIESSINAWYDQLTERIRLTETIDYFADISKVLSYKLKVKAAMELEYLQSKWSTTFLQFYEEKLSDLVDRSGRWSTEPLNLYDPFLGVKVGFSKHFENVFDNLEQWSDAPVNALILCMYNFQQFFLHHVDLAMKGLSEEFVLKKRYLCYKKQQRKNANSLPPNKNNASSSSAGLEHILNPEEIVEIVKESLNLVFPQEEINFSSVETIMEEVVETTPLQPTPPKRPRRTTRSSAQYRNDEDYVEDVGIENEDDD